MKHSTANRHCGGRNVSNENKVKYKHAIKDTPDTAAAAGAVGHTLAEHTPADHYRKQHWGLHHKAAAAVAVWVGHRPVEHRQAERMHVGQAVHTLLAVVVVPLCNLTAGKVAVDKPAVDKEVAGKTAADRTVVDKAAAGR
ncbi:hypothetical protein Pmar_PMAR019522 [Perkinsus marinus ATCC 50983]|uniref:Uncharacterized protein n=1 Tax=Perkinsus marinus (strain ATCC 50983 / TXsc) TaxID=423536 RepID=C5KR92_PERM5|nr:hypothetical protein Pmar_PMAR019522 [Perkinsus marinus ATCC 50983]EER12993.1 hypothetical protein Pmar_PMAR019522 [Perkinsus marinus ATCC 50983]|eukprot:XP_002781198.1 hypothetical protein Pmar_PMAR019522 [Perkinsus marinus ATCC 50983]